MTEEEVIKRYGPGGLASHRDCTHQNKELGQLHCDDGRIQVKEWCPDCGKTFAAVKKTAGWETLPVIDRDLNYRLWDAEHKARLAAREARNAEWWEWYNSYLETPQWAAKRAAVMRRDNYTCQGCLEEKATQVHHFTYEHAGNEFLFELVSVCRTCHERLHLKEDAQ